MKRIIMYLAAAASAAVAVTSVLLFVFSVKNVAEPVVDTSIEATELTGYGGKYKFWFSQLNNEEKHAYNLILECIYSMPDEIEINRIDSEMLDNVFYALTSDNPDLFFVGRKCSLRTVGSKTWFAVDYIVDKNEYETMKKELNAVCDEVISGCSNTSDLWQTELEIHDYIIDNCIYSLDSNPLGSTAYGVLVNGEGACEGYSKAAKLLLDRAEIENTIISGVSESETSERGPHMWNAVNLDGNWYHLDCTWDDPVDEGGLQSKTYTYFNLDDKTISKTHFEFSYELGCDALQENYFVKTGAYFESYDRSCEEKLASIIINETQAGNDTVYFRFADKQTYDEAVKELIEKERIYHILKIARDSSEFEFSTNSTGYITDGENLIFALVPKYTK